MHPYLTHLLADIAAAHRQEHTREKESIKSFEEEMEAVEKWIAGEEPEHTLGYYCGLKSANFPPAEQLTAAEMNMVINALREMMSSWNQGIDLPEALPTPIAYAMNVDALNMGTTIVNDGMMHFDFCSGNAPDCIFKEYCPCLEIWNRASDNNDMPEDATDTNKENPF